MATVVNNPGAVERERIVSTDSGAGWAVAILILLALIAVGGYVLTQRAAPAQTPVDNPSANINVTLPEVGTPTNPSGNASETQPPATNPTTP